MLRKRGLFRPFLLVTSCVAILVLLFWGIAAGGRPGQTDREQQREQPDETPSVRDVVADIHRSADTFEGELNLQRKIIQRIQTHLPRLKVLAGRTAGRRSVLRPDVIPILVIACNRVTVRRCLDALLQYRPSAELYPIIVSQDCGHAETAKVIASYGDQVTFLKHPDLTDVAMEPQHGTSLQGYYKLARHYRWALNQVFRTLAHSSVVIVEDDLEVAPDFFEYFRALRPVLESDPSLWCVSAWNDNGMHGFVDAAKAELLHRSDFFPGLGWMLLRELWDEVEPKWPAAFWDDWMRRPEQRLDRACVRPEISRTFTFGEHGVSQGEFYHKYLRHMKLNSRYVPFTKLDHGYLKGRYGDEFENQVYGAPVVSYEEVKQGKLSGSGPFRLQYSNMDSFMRLAQNLGIMDDLKSGVPRAAYRGVVTIMSRGKRIYLAPPFGWTGYDSSRG